MGVKLTELIPKKEIEFDSLKGKTIAIDASNMFYQFLSSIRQPDGTPLMDSKGRITSHLVGTFSRLSNLMARGIKLCVVFDGKPPSLKYQEQESRAHRKEIAKEKFEIAKEKEDVEEMAKYAKQITRLTQDMVNESKELLKAMGIPVIQSPSESDAQMAFMNEKGDIWACATSDVDPLLHGAPRLITNLTLSQRKRLPSGAYIKIKPEIVELEQVLKTLDLSQDQLIALAILVGTDYNRGGVKKIGPKTALKLVREYKSFDKIFKEVQADFNWKKIYAIFKSMPIMKNYQLKWSPPDQERIKKLLIDQHDFSEQRVEKTLGRLIKEKENRTQTGLNRWTK